ncbi:MAG TPA: NFACT RNA binding domain-containing protein [Ktedonobacteraceae bacterium]|nr:NFACT RNA binding domain-containing protein [Ktedonobacteraceae bacterium]
MFVDAITLAAVADEWRSMLTGARIDTIIQPTEHAVAIQSYTPGAVGQGGQNRWLYLSAHPQLARVHLTTLRPAKISSEPPSFIMLLRKYLEGTRIESIEQPRWERIIEIIASHRRDAASDERVRYRLIIEIMGRLSNIIFCDEQGLILGSLKHVGADVNRYRVIAPNVPYVPPPPQVRAFGELSLPRLDPAMLTASQLESVAKEEAARPAPVKKSRARTAEQPALWQLLSRNLLGFSPLLAREAVYRTTGDTESLITQDENTWEELAWNVRELAALYAAHAWKPQLIERVEYGDNTGRPQGQNAPTTSPGRPQGYAPTIKRYVAFAPYALEQYAEIQGASIHASSSINAIIDEFYAGAEWRDAIESVRAPIRKVLQTQLERCKRKAELLQRELAVSEEANQYRLWAELLLTYQNEVQQGQQSVTLQNFFEGQEIPSLVTIPLDPRLDAVGNANRIFHKYHKLRRALALLPPQIGQNTAEIATIEQLLADLMLADTPPEVALVKAEAQTAGYIRGAKAIQKQQKQHHKGKGGKQTKGKPVPPGGGVPLHAQSRDGFTILIGKNSRQNEEVTFHQATANDMWLHARGVPGAHVIIKAGGRDIPRSAIEQAAALAAWYSQARGSTSVPVDYTLQRHVRHMKGGGPGMVIYERERTVYAEPEGIQ